MKKIIILTFLILLITGCSDKTSQVEESKTNSNKIVEEEKKDTYIDTNPIKLGLYLTDNSSKERILATEYITEWTLNKDLCSLEIFYTNEEKLSNIKQKELWNNYYNNYKDIDNYKVGFKIEFITKEKEISKTILSPQDTEEIYDYMQIYLYDDINQQDGTWYSHITNEEFNERTIISSIKLTGSTKTNEITSNITLTVFTYDYDDFDENNEYRGISQYTTIIKRS